MNEQQKNIIETFGLGQSVIAGAGCGKTTTLVAKCLALMERNPKARFCAVSFTEKSVRDLKESLVKGFGTVRLEPSHWVKTLHGLCSTIIQEFPVSAGLLGGERVLMEDEALRLWTRSVSVLWTSSDNPEISASVAILLEVYSRAQLENLFVKLRALVSFGVANFITPEMQDLWRVFQSVYSRYQHAKDREGALDFNDLELLALKALKDPEVAKYYQDRFDLVLVDEFQDTNPIQGEILERFVKPGFPNLCIVGDPKQSIYRFRDADVSVFQDLTARLPSKHLLEINYRSRPGIIDFVNQVCAPTFVESDLPYEVLEAGREEDAQEIRTPRVSKLELDSENDLAEFLKAEAARGIDLSEFVILARSVRKDKTVKFLRALEEAHIPFLLGSGGRFYSDPRVIEIVAFLRGWISSKNSLSQVAALRSPWIGVSDDEFLQWNEANRDQYFETFFRTSSHPVAQALASDYLNPGRVTVLRPGQILEKLLKIEQFEEELYMPLVSLWHKCETLSGQGRRFEEVIQVLSDAVDKEKIEKEIPAPAEKGMVRILTVHSAKGLQFPRVILTDFDGEYKSPGSTQDLIWDRKKGVHLFKRDEEGKRDAKDPTNLEWTKLEKLAQVAESKRVFYVALTRAQEELILVWKKEIKRTKASLLPEFNPHLTDNWRAWVEVSQIPPSREWVKTPAQASLTGDADPLPQPVYQAQKIRDFDPQPYRPRHSPSEWMILSQCELRYRKKFGMIDVEELHPPRVTLTDIELGDIETADEPVGLNDSVIAALVSDTDIPLPTPSDRSFSKSETAEKGERIHTMIEQENWSELASEFTSESLGLELSQKLKLLLQADPGVEIYREFGFESPLSGYEALVGMMDRLEVDSDNKRVRIIDYKFTARPKAPADLLHHYLLQLKLYAWAASKLVDFIPEKIEARLIHLTEDGIEIVEANPLDFSPEKLNAEVARLFSKARGKSAQPTLGQHCRFCEFTSTCPAYQAMM